jgi:divalent metal cation (Fe/Co/Zn/Cd) transporter
MTVVYAIVGIPIMLITLNDLGKFLYKSINDLLGAYDRRLAWLRKLWHKDRSVSKADEVNAMEQGNNTHAPSATDEPPHHVSFNLRLVLLGFFNKIQYY